MTQHSGKASWGLLLLALLGMLIPADFVHAKEQAKPNIVFFLIDDLGRNDVGFMGSKRFQTPQIDKLAKGGVILDAHYVQPVCSPTRAALMTGRYATRTGVYTVVRPKAAWGLSLEERTLPQALHDAGYESAIVGKWHLGEFQPGYLPMARGFDHQYGHYFGMIDYFDHTRNGMRDWHRSDKPSSDEGYSTHLIAKEAVQRIKKRDKSKPLFLYVPFNGVHAPMQVPESYAKPYANLPTNQQKLGGMLAAVDEAIGQIVAALEAEGMRKETLILFSSDNGGPNPKQLSDNGELRAGKGTIYEGGVRVCAFANWPEKLPAGKTITEPMHMIDWYPTLIQLAGGSLEQKLPLDGLNVWPMLAEGAKSPHESILSVQSPTRAAVRMGDWKLLMNASAQDSEAAEEATTEKSKAKGKAKAKAKAQSGNNVYELYNLAEDRSESQNLAGKEPQRLQAMQTVLQGLLKDAVAPRHLGKQD